MVVGCGNKCVKYFFLLVNFLFFVLGGVICGLSLWIRFDNSFQSTVLGILQPNSTSANTLQLDSLYIILYVIAALGLILCILGFLGCCGSCVESACTLGLYFTLVLILFVLLLAGGIYVLVNRGNMKQNFENLWRQEFVYNYNALPAELKANVDSIQTNLQCCGATGCQDFATPAIPPLSCNCTTTTGAVPRMGCADTIYNAIDANLTIVIIVAAAVLIVELFAMIFACILCNAVKEKSSMNF